MRGTLLSFVVILCGLFAAYKPAMAQGDGSIQGLAVARADGSALPGVKIALHGDPVRESLETQTGPDGRFAFLRVVPGDYRLTAVHEEFSTEQYWLAIRPREAQNLTLEMSLRPIEQSVDVSAEAYSIPTAHSPGSTLLSSRTMEALPSPQRTNLPDAIVTSSPGMIRGHDDFVHVRGHEVALNPFINGVSFWENSHTVFSPGLGVDYSVALNLAGF